MTSITHSFAARPARSPRVRILSSVLTNVAVRGHNPGCSQGFRSNYQETSLGSFANLDFIAELFDAARQTLRGPLFIGAGEIERSEIAVRHPIAQAIIGDGKNGGGHCDDGFLWSTPGAEPDELRVEIVVLVAARRPGALHQHGFEPRGSVA